MGRREWLTEAGWQQAYDGGIRTVIDLRNPDEIRRRDTDPRVSAETLAAFDVVHAPTEDPGNSEFRELCVPYLNDPASYADNARIFPEKLAGGLQSRGGGTRRRRDPLLGRPGPQRDDRGHAPGPRRRGRGAPLPGATSAPCGASTNTTGVSGVPHPHERYLPEDVLAPLLESRRESLLRFVRRVKTGRVSAPQWRNGRRAGCHSGQIGALE